MIIDQKLIEYAQLMERIGEPVLIDYVNPSLEKLMTRGEWQELTRILNKDERRCITYYKSHRRGECCCSPRWIPYIESAIAKIEAELQRRANLRWVVLDQKTGLYWVAVINPPYWGSKRRAFLFRVGNEWIANVVKRSGRRFFLETIDATSRLNRSSF